MLWEMKVVAGPLLEPAQVELAELAYCLADWMVVDDAG